MEDVYVDEVLYVWSIYELVEWEEEGRRLMEEKVEGHNKKG